MTFLEKLKILESEFPTKQALCDALGVTYSAFWLWEKGLREPAKPTIKLVDFMVCSLGITSKKRFKN